jgi:hypothetical protein
MIILRKLIENSKILKSKFKFRVILILILIIALLSLTIYTLMDNLPIKIEKIRWIDVFMSVLLFFTLIWLIFGVLRTQIISITINDNQIKKKNYLGFNKQYSFKDFDGFQTSILTSKGVSFEYLYFVKEGEKIIKISEAYHKNYSNLKDIISTHLKDLGEIQFSYFDEFKEVFK